MKHVQIIESMIDRAVRNETEEKEGYARVRRQQEDVYECIVRGSVLQLYHYSTLIFFYDPDTYNTGIGGAFSVSDRDAINTAADRWASHIRYRSVSVNMVQGELEMTLQL